jgi:hypothetical protein
MPFSRLTLPPIFRWTENTLAAGDLAKAFLADEWDLSPADRTWLIVLSCSFKAEGWHIVELGIYGCPDTWVIQVYDTGLCDPCYTFKPAHSQSERIECLEILPDAIAAMLLAEHAQLESPYIQCR